MIKKILYTILPVIIISAFVSCSNYQKIVKSSDVNLKYDMAVKYYNSQDYYHALQLFEELLTYFRGTAKAEKIQYYYAYSNYGMENYVLASYYFKNFTSTYPNSEYAEESSFMAAYCYYLDSPSSSLDPANTYTAIKELQLFTNTYPKSKRVAECNELIDKLRSKLERKFFDISMLYYNTSDYRAAIISFNNVLKDFPDTKYKERILFYTMKANYLFATKSVETKKKERFNSTIEAYNVFRTNFKLSEYNKEAESIYKNSIKELNKYKTKTKNS
ncbi:MAG: outer membrane protein assembly factor BamD [Bacteroidota bacterium]|nr:outer membrane protein assembly factor BamD [Bacteroidota bacterium]